jgi:hypothetical protein
MDPHGSGDPGLVLRSFPLRGRITDQSLPRTNHGRAFPSSGARATRPLASPALSDGSRAPPPRSGRSPAVLPCQWPPLPSRGHLVRIRPHSIGRRMMLPLLRLRFPLRHGSAAAFLWRTPTDRATVAGAHNALSGQLRPGPPFDRTEYRATPLSRPETTAAVPLHRGTGLFRLRDSLYGRTAPLNRCSCINCFSSR